MVFAPPGIPAKLMKALAVLTDALHPSFDEQPWAVPGKSKGSCILATLTACDFLTGIGLYALPRSVACFMRADRGETVLHTLGVGVPAAAYGTRKPIEGADLWDGHLVVTVPEHRLLIDLTLYLSIRPQWQGVLTGMIAVPYQHRPRPREMLFGRPVIARAATDPDADQFVFAASWLDRPENKGWRKAPDAEPRRRDGVLALLRKRFDRCRSLPGRPMPSSANGMIACR
jgi:hypothetical protein